MKLSCYLAGSFYRTDKQSLEIDKWEFESSEFVLEISFVNPYKRFIRSLVPKINRPKISWKWEFKMHANKSLKCLLPH